jgi:DNA polymerase sigma
LSSYSTVLLIVAYMNYFGMKGVNNPDMAEMSPSKLLMGFLEFYGNHFNPAIMSISVYDEG